MSKRSFAGKAAAVSIAAMLAAVPALADRRTESISAFEQGFQRFQKGDVKGARIEAMKSLKVEPRNAQARILIARILLDAGNGVAAQTEIEKGIAAGFPRDKTHHLMAHALLLQRQYPRALAEADPVNIPDQFASYAARMRGRVQVALGAPERAEAEFVLANRLAANDPETLIDLGRFRSQSGDAAAGEKLVDQALGMDPTNMRALLLKGDLARGSQGLEKSLVYFNRALQVDPNSIEALLERAGTLGDLRREDEARADLKKIQGLTPDNPLALYLGAVMEARASRFAQANAMMGRTKGLLNDYPPALMLQGMLAYQLNNMSQAEVFLAKVVDQVPQSELARKLFASVQVRKGDNEGALKTLKPLLDSGKADARTYAIAGSAYSKQGDFKTAQSYLEKAATSAPKEPALQTQLAMTQIAQGNDAAATKVLGNVLKTDPKSLQGLTMATLLQMRDGKYREAIGTAGQLVANYPQQPFGYNLRGAALLGTGDKKGAEADFRAALARKPDFIESRRNLAQLLIATGRPDQARQELLKVIEYKRDDARSMMALADIARARNNSEERIKWLKQAAGVAPKDVTVRLALARAYIQTGFGGRALAEASTLGRDFPDNPAVIELVGLTDIAAKRPTEAEAMFQKLVTLVPNQTGPRILLARSLALQGREEDARQAYAQALTLTKQNLIPVYIDAIALEARAKNMPRVMVLIEQLRKAYPGRSIADQIMGDIKLTNNDLPGALAAYQSARKTLFDRSVAMRMATVYDRANQPAQALGVLQAYTKLQPNDPVALATIGTLYLELKQYRPAIATYEALRKRTPSDPIILNNLAWSYHQLGDKQAIPLALAAAKAAPANAAILDTAGIVLVDTRANVANGVALLQRAVKASPRDPNIRYHLGFAYKVAGKPDAAVKELTLALKAPKFDNRAASVKLLQSLR